MQQRDLDRAVAGATGESVSEISRRGFVPLCAVPYEQDPEDLIVDWDERQSLEPHGFTPRRRPLACHC